MGSSTKVDTPSGEVDGADEDGPLLNTTLYDEVAGKLGLTTKTAQAKEHGVRRPYWSQIYNRRRSPSFKFARKVARQMGLSTDALWPDV